MTDLSLMYPIAIIQDRYGGTYSGGAWLAISESDLSMTGCEGDYTRIDFCLSDGPSSNDVTTAEFWVDPPDWIAVGDTPDEALAALIEKEKK